MAISDDTRAIVAAQLTAAWAGRVGHAGDDERGSIGPVLLDVYRQFLHDLREPEPDIRTWIDGVKE